MSTASRVAFGLNAAQGLSLQVARTWSPTLVREPRLLVPVHLDVLMVRAEGGTWARTAPVLGDDNRLRLPPPFAEADTPRPRGAYLMWAPPDALAEGEQPPGDAQGALRFPGLPDRWLVLRLAPSSRVSGRRTVSGWVLRGDEPGAGPVPLDQYTEGELAADGVRSPPLTVMGPGQLNWVGYYDNVAGRFAFHDALADVAAGPVSYLVCGWYRDPDDDPLADPDIRTLHDFKARLQAYGWDLPDHLLKQAQEQALKHQRILDEMGLEVRTDVKTARRTQGADDVRVAAAQARAATPAAARAERAGRAASGLRRAAAAWWPRHSLYHGAVVGLGWPSPRLTRGGRALLSEQGEEVGGPPPAATVSVGLGQTLSEAIGAIVAQRNGRPAQERLLQAFQLGALRELDEPDGRAKVDALLHATTFASRPGGSVVERVFQPPLGEPPKVLAPAGRPAPGIFERYRHRDGSAPRFRAELAGDKAPVRAGAAAAQKAAPGVRVETLSFAGKALQAEATARVGGVSAAMKGLGLGSTAVPYRPGRWVDRERPLPRLYLPLDPVIVVEGIRRSYHHGGDGRHSAQRQLGVRLTGAWIKEYRHPTMNQPVAGEDVLDRGVANGSVPPECEHLLHELVLLDPGAAPAIVRAGAAGRPGGRAAAADNAAAAQRVTVHQTAWWSARDPRVDPSASVSLSPFVGTLPSPVAMALPSRPWNPLHIDWRLEYTPSPAKLDNWTLGELDFNEDAPEVPPPGSVTPIVIEGRSVLAAGAGLTLAGAIRRSLDEALRTGSSGSGIDVDAVHAYASPVARRHAERMSARVMRSSVPGDDAAERDALADVASQLEQMDVLSAGFDGLHTALRAGLPGDGETGAPAVPPGFHALRAGFLRVLRLRVVDGFGQVLDLAGSGPQTPAQPQRMTRSLPLQVTGRPELLALPPRFTAPARLMLRFTDAGGGPDEARSETDREPAVSPVCGYLMPNHLDDALLFFEADGRDAGVVRRDEDGRIVWEDAPGAPSHVGASPAQAIANGALAAIAQGLLDWGVADAGLDDNPNDTALRSLLRVIDTTRWGVDPFGHQGEEHLSLLVGHPVVVVRAVLRLEVRETVDRGAVDEQLVPVRLGALAQWQDGLLGYFGADDFRRLRCADAAVAELARAFGPQQGFLQAVEDVPGYAASLDGNGSRVPVTHGYIDRSGVLWVRPNQDLRLVLLVEPHTLVHATCGVLPRKEVGLKKEWTAAALARLSPTFRFGPVLIDPKNVRMPVAADLHGTWSWDHRSDVTTWENRPVTHATQDALLPQDAPQASEGWLRLRPLDEDAAAAGAQGDAP